MPGSLSRFDIQLCAVKKKYELKRRAEKQAETRDRIVRATVELHTSLGPARTSVSAIAERAGVQRHTVYAHFPDERSLFAACSSHWRAQHPFPDVEAWLGEPDARRRLRRALRELYAWYAEVEQDLSLFRRDGHHPVQRALLDAGDRRLEDAADALAAGLSRRKGVRAAVGHALAFETWRSLVRREGLSRDAAVAAMLGLIETIR